MSDGISDTFADRDGWDCPNCNVYVTSHPLKCMCGYDASRLAKIIIGEGAVSTDDVKDPDHYAKIFPGVEAYSIIKTILNTHFQHLTPYEAFQIGNVFKYKLRCGYKDDGEGGMKDVKKAMRCREMADE